MTLAGIAILFLGASQVSIAVAPGITCLERRRLVSRLETGGLQIAESGPRLVVTVRPDGGQVKVKATRPGASFERTVPVEREACEAVERIVAALITSWAHQLPSLDSPETLPPPPARPAALAAPEPEAVPEPPVPPLPEPEPVPVLIQPSSIESGPAPRNEVSKPAEQAPKSAGATLTLDLAALGGASVGPTPAVSGLGQLQVGLGFGRLGALLEGGLESRRAGDLGGARVETTSQWVSLSARVRLEPLDRLHFDLALGFRLWRIAALGLGLNGSRTLELAGVGGVLSAGASLRLAGPLFAHLRAFASLRSQGDRFLFEGLGPVLDLRPLTGGLLLGLQVRTFGD